MYYDYSQHHFHKPFRQTTHQLSLRGELPSENARDIKISTNSSSSRPCRPAGLAPGERADTSTSLKPANLANSLSQQIVYGSRPPPLDQSKKPSLTTALQQPSSPSRARYARKSSTCPAAWNYEFSTSHLAPYYRTIVTTSTTEVRPTDVISGNHRSATCTQHSKTILNTCTRNGSRRLMVLLVNARRIRRCWFCRREVVMSWNTLTSEVQR